MFRGSRSKLLWKMTGELRSPSSVANCEVDRTARPPTADRALFRREVLEFQQHTRQWGRVVPLQPLPIRLAIWLVAITIAVVIAFLFLAQYARKETALGYLVPSAGSARIFAQQQGTVSAVYVAQGQQVEQGQPVLAVATDQTAIGGEDVYATILATLTQQKQSLVGQIANEVRHTASERERLTAQISGLEAELAHLAAEQDVQRLRINLFEKMVSSGAQLAAKGLISELDQRRREDAVLEQRRALIALGEQTTARQGRLTNVRFNLEQLQFAQAEKIQSLRNELSSVEQRIAEVEGRRAHVLRSPISGTVSLLLASVGQRADPQRLQLEIVPVGSKLQAQLFVPAKAIGFIEPGQNVRLLYDAFPYQQFGTYRGWIAEVSHTLLTPNDIAVPVPLKEKEPVYKVVVALEREDVDAYGKKMPLRPDMLLKADIILERRTLVQWILQPLLSARLQG
jgi:membrane fusion protein